MDGVGGTPHLALERLGDDFEADSRQTSLSGSSRR